MIASKAAAPELHVQVDGLDHLADGERARWPSGSARRRRRRKACDVDQRQELLRPPSTPSTQAYADAISYWTTPTTNCLDGRGDVCKDYAAWTRRGPRSRADDRIDDAGCDGPLRVDRRGRPRASSTATRACGWRACSRPPCSGSSCSTSARCAVMFVTAFWTIDDFTGGVIRSRRSTTSARCCTNPVYRTVALRTLGVAVCGDRRSTWSLALPIAFYMAKVGAAAACAARSSSRSRCRSGPATW